MDHLNYKLLILLLLLLHPNPFVIGQALNPNYGQQDHQEYAQQDQYGQPNLAQSQAQQSPFGQQSLSQGPYGQPNQAVGQSVYRSPAGLGPVNRTGFGFGSGIRLEVMLRSYFNSGFKLGSDGSSCRCPADSQVRW